MEGASLGSLNDDTEDHLPNKNTGFGFHMHKQYISTVISPVWATAACVKTTNIPSYYDSKHPDTQSLKLFISQCNLLVLYELKYTRHFESVKRTMDVKDYFY